MNQNLPSRLLAEAIGTFALTFVGAAVICTDSYSGGSAGLLGIALAHGLVLAALLVAFGSLSGGHVNPAVSLACVIARRLPAREGAAYVGAQLGGAALAGLMLTATFGADVWAPVSLGTPVLGPGVAAGTGNFLEAVLSFFLVLTFLRVMPPRGHVAAGRGLAVGAAYAAGILAGGPLTGAALNPARAFGPALASGSWTSHHVYWIGPAIGGVLAAVCHMMLMSARTVDPGSAESHHEEAEEE